MKIGILGAGISGLSIGKLLSDRHEIEVLERDNIHGGIARTKSVDGVAYHLTGGHCFNSKYPDVLDFVFSKVMSIDQWHKISRDSVIRFKGNEINYPIEFSIKQIYSFNSQLAIDIVKDFLNADDDNTYLNLEDWFRKKFGNTLADEYFIPYNKKIWNKNPKDMDPSWVEDKLPIPNLKSFFHALVDSSKDMMPHSEFYYPNSNNQNSFLDKLADGLNIKYNIDIKSLRFDAEMKKWIVNNEFYYDLIITTLPLNEIPNIILNCPDLILNAASELEYNKVTTMLWETKHTTRTWSYFPDANTLFHRQIHIGSFFKPAKNYTITEAVGVRTYDEMVENGLKDPFLVKPLDYHVSNHAYVVFDDNYKKNKDLILDYLKSIQIYSVGRFAEWEYYNMDVCIKKAIDLNIEIDNIIKQQNEKLF